MGHEQSTTRQEKQMTRELLVLKTEYKRALEQPTFDDPKDYCVLLDLIQDKIEQMIGENK